MARQQRQMSAGEKTLSGAVKPNNQADADETSANKQPGPVVKPVPPPPPSKVSRVPEPSPTKSIGPSKNELDALSKEDQEVRWFRLTVYFVC